MGQVIQVLALAAALLLAAPAARAAEPTAVWSGRSGGLTVTWTTSNIVARRDGRLVFSVRQLARTGLAHFIAVNRGPGEAPPDCDYQRRFRPLALVSTLLSLEDRTEFTCRREAHLGGETRLLTIDLADMGPLLNAGHNAIGQVDPRRPGRAVLLTALFPVPEVQAALAVAPPIRDVLRRDGVQPATLSALLEAVADAAGVGEDCYTVPSDLLSRFALDRLTGSAVMVRLGLPGGGPCRMMLTVAELAFAIPPALAKPLHAAAAGRAGFLAVSARPNAAAGEIIIALRSGRGAGRR